MAVTFLLPAASDTPQGRRRRHHHHQGRKRKNTATTARPPPPTKPPVQSSWEQFKSLLSCRTTPFSQVHDPSAPKPKPAPMIRTCGSSICAIRDVVHGNTRVVHRSDSTDHHYSETAPFARSQHPSRSGGMMQLPKLSGCYECQAISVEPLSRRYPRPRAVCACSECGEAFTKPESLELHQILRHAVSELGPEDSGRNIVEMIFKSSWQSKDRPVCMIERVLKVHNTERTVARFEDYRDSVKARALAGHHARPNKKNPRCAADGNELLRFHCTTLACSLGGGGSTALCINSSAPGSTFPCGVCTIIRHGFARANQTQHPHHGHGVTTTASSGRAHECGVRSAEEGERRAMLVCRVIAGRVRRSAGDDEEVGASSYDSVAGGEGGQYANLEELFVSNPRAILPCFVVIYRALD